MALPTSASAAERDKGVSCKDATIVSPGFSPLAKCQRSSFAVDRSRRGGAWRRGGGGRRRGGGGRRRGGGGRQWRRRAALAVWLAVASGASAFGGASGRGGSGVRRTQRAPPRRRAVRDLPHAQLRASAPRRPRRRAAAHARAHGQSPIRTAITCIADAHAGRKQGEGRGKASTPRRHARRVDVEVGPGRYFTPTRSAHNGHLARVPGVCCRAALSYTG